MGDSFNFRKPGLERGPRFSEHRDQIVALRPLNKTVVKTRDGRHENALVVDVMVFDQTDGLWVTGVGTTLCWSDVVESQLGTDDTMWTVGRLEKLDPIGPGEFPYWALTDDDDVDAARDCQRVVEKGQLEENRLSYLSGPRNDGHQADVGDEDRDALIS